MRHMALVGLPGYASLTATAWASSSIQAQHEICGAGAVTPEIAAAKAPAIVKRIGELMDEKMQGSNEQKRVHLSALTMQFEGFAGRSGKVYENVLETVLKAVLILAWGTFETLSEDLHVAVQEESPKLFSPGKFYFRRRAEIRKSYETAFQSDVAITAALAAPAIDALSLTRNLLVHKSGIVDEKFKQESAGIALLSSFNSLAIGEPIRIDGPFVLGSVDPAVESGYDLVEAVDAWLTKRSSAPPAP